MTDTPRSSTLLSRVRSRLQITSVARALLISTTVVLGAGLLVVLAIRLLGLIPRADEQYLWLLALPAIAVLAAAIFHRRIEQQSAARAVDQYANTKDLFLTLSSLSDSAGEYQPLVATSAEERAEKIAAGEVVPFGVDQRVAVPAVFAGLLTLLILFCPQLDPFGRVEAATKVEEQKKEIEAIRHEAKKRTDRLKKEIERSEENAEEINNKIGEMKKDFRKMKPKKVESNTKVLDEHRMELGDLWKTAAQNEQLRRMMNEPISGQRLGTRSEKMNEWLKELQEGKSDKLKQALDKAQQTMEKMLKAETPEEREKLANELQKDLQDLQRFSKNKAGSKALTDALSKALKSLQASKKQPGEKGEQGEQSELNAEAMEALKESLELSEKEMEQLANSAKEMKKLEDALKTLQQAQQLNQKQQLDGSKCEGCETLQDYAELYAQLMGQGAGDGEKDRNEGGGGGVGKGGETPEDDSDPEGYKTEKEKPQIRAGKILLSIKTREYAEEKDFDPEKMRQYQKSLSSLKSSVQSAIDSEEIPPGYVEGIKGYFDKIEDVDPKLKSE